MGALSWRPEARQDRAQSMSEMVKAAPPKEIDTALLVTAKNPRGIPEVVFIVSFGGSFSRGQQPAASQRNLLAGRKAVRSYAAYAAASRCSHCRRD